MRTNVAALSRRLGETLDLPRAFVSSLADSARSRQRFDDVEAYCMFIGYSRSGHSLLGSLVDAHPDAVIAHELDALRLFHLGFRKSQVYSLILERERQYALGEREKTGRYDYAVPGQWQGRYRQLRVIGDKKGGRSTRRLGSDPDLLDRVKRILGTSLRIIHVVRNPYDNIATMYQRRNAPLDRRVDYYFSLCRTVSELKQRLEVSEVIDVRHEDVVSHPAAELTRLGSFLDLDISSDFVEDCASILFPSPRRTRDSAPWTDELLTRVQDGIDQFDFLRGYSFR